MDTRSEYLAHLTMVYEEQSEYHNHKESMAWLTTAAYIAAAGFVFVQDDVNVERWVLLNILLSLVFLAGMVLVFWQLLNRRRSVITQSDARELLWKELVRSAQGHRDIDEARLAEHESAPKEHWWKLLIPGGILIGSIVIIVKILVIGRIWGLFPPS